MYRFIVMICGYVENAMTSTLIYQCQFFGNPGYSSKKEAVTDLALDLYSKYYDDHLSVYERRYSRDVKDCCRAALIANKEAKYCSDCGNQISDRKFDPEAFMEYITALHSSTCDSYGDAEYAGGRNLKWWPYWTDEFIGAPKEDVIFIGENAEVVLLEALIEAKPEIKAQVDEGDLPYSSTDWEEIKNE